MMQNLIPLITMTRNDLADIIPHLEDPQEQQEAIRRIREHDAQIKTIEEADHGDK